jgi:hypothetical protein
MLVLIPLFVSETRAERYVPEELIGDFSTQYWWCACGSVSAGLTCKSNDNSVPEAEEAEEGQDQPSQAKICGAGLMTLV